MHDGLHLAAILVTAVAAAGHPGWRRRSTSSGLVAAVLMLTAMVDVAYLHRVGAPLWSAVLLAAAIAISALRSPRRRGTEADAPGIGDAATHDALGLVVMAALLALMHTPAIADSAAEHAGHGASRGALVAVVIALVFGYAAAMAVGWARARRSAHRAQYVLMGAAAILMAGATVA